MTTSVGDMHPRDGDKRATARTVNNRIRVAAQGLHGDAQADFVCECVHERCFATVSMTAGEWRAATAEPGYFVIRPGHVGEGEEAVVETGGYALVRPVDASAKASSAGADIDLECAGASSITGPTGKS